MEENYAALPTSHLLGSVPAVKDDNKATNSAAPTANMQTFPPNNGVGRNQGYQTIGAPSETLEQEPANGWKGFFSVSSYTQYFNVDTDIVVNRLLSSLHPVGGDFFSKVDSNPDLYGLIWITTTLVFCIGSLGNCATYLQQKRSDSTTIWSFDVNYLNVAAFAVYGYAILVPMGFYFLLQYLGLNAGLIRFWCMWGYSLFIFIFSSFLLLIPVEFFRWIIILATGAASSSFVALNLKSYIESNDITMVVAAAFFLQMCLAVFIKGWFFA